MDIASIKKEAQTILSSLIVSCAKGLTVYRLRKDYREETGQDIPFKKLGFDTFEKFLHSIPETCQVNGYGDNAVVIPVINAKNKHINDMVLKQRPPKSTARYKSIRRSRGIDNRHLTYQRPVEYKLPVDFSINANSHNVSLPPPHDYFLEERQKHNTRQPVIPRFQKSYNHVKHIPPEQPNYANHSTQQYKLESYNQFYDKYTVPGLNSQYNSTNQTYQTNNYIPIDSSSARQTKNQSTDSNHNGPIDTQTPQNQTPQSSSQNQRNNYVAIDSKTPQNQSYNNSRSETVASRFAIQLDRNRVDKSSDTPINKTSTSHASEIRPSSDAPTASQCVSESSSKARCDSKISDTRSSEVNRSLHYYDESDLEEYVDSDNDFSDAEDADYVYHSDEEGVIGSELQALAVNDNIEEYYKEIINKQSREANEVYELGVKDADHESRVNPKVQQKLRALISEYPDGIWCSKLLKMYHVRYKSHLDPQEYGFTSVIELCDDMPNIFHCVRPNRTDWKLYDRNLPKPGICGTQQFSNYLRTLNQSPEPNNTEPPIPDGFKQVMPYLYPDTVVKLGDSIPKEWLVNDEQQGDYLEVVVAEVYDPSKFWIQLKGLKTSDALNTLMDDMQLFYSNNFETYKLNDMNAFVGLYCAALFMNEYHRAVIARLYDDGTMKVFYIDYGTVGEVILARTCLLHKSFSVLPQQAIRSRLANIRPKEPNTMWSRAAAKHMLELIMEKHLIAYIHSINEAEKILHLIITDTTSPDVDVHINDSLVENDFAVVGNEVRMCSTSRASVPNVHLYPTFTEIESNIYPSVSDLIKMLKLDQTYETIFDRYFNNSSTTCMHSPDMFSLSHCSSNFDQSISSLLSPNNLCITSVGEDESANEQTVETIVEKVILLEKNIEDIEIDNGNGDIACEEVVEATPNDLEESNKSSEEINEKPGFWNTDNLQSVKRDNQTETHFNPRITSPPPGFENVKPLINNPDLFGCAPLVPGFQQYYNPIYHPVVPQLPIRPASYFPDYRYFDNFMNNPFMMNQLMIMHQQQNWILTAQKFVEIQKQPHNQYLPRPDNLGPTPDRAIIYSKISDKPDNQSESSTSSSPEPNNPVAICVETNSGGSISSESALEESQSSCDLEPDNISDIFDDALYYSNDDEDKQQLDINNVSNTSIDSCHSTVLRNEHICKRYVLKINISNKTLHIIKINDELYVASQEIITSLLESEASLRNWLKSQELDDYIFPNKLINLVSHTDVYNQIKSFTIPGMYAPNNLGCNVRLTLLKDVIPIIEKFGDHSILPDLKSGIDHVNTECLWTILESTD